jgi:hypothetical protein
MNKYSSVKLTKANFTADSAWYVDQVLIKESEHALKEFLFPCGHWLEASEDGPAVMELPLLCKCTCLPFA